jgi:hypothetical protein
MGRFKSVWSRIRRALGRKGRARPVVLACLQCSRPLQRIEPPGFLLHAGLTIYRCLHCREEIPFRGETVEPPKHYMLTADGVLKDLPPDAPRQWS